MFGELGFGKISSYVVAVLIGLIVGYFAGREHVKYELRQSIQAAAQEMQMGLSGLFNDNAGDLSKPQSKQENESPSASLNEPPTFKVTLLKKRFQHADYSAGIQEAITISVSFENLTGKNIRAFDGILGFNDLLDNEILTANLAINDPVAVGKILKWNGQIDYNQFMDNHQRLRSEDASNLKIVFKTRKILFADGTTKEFE